jgi:hypothetical protein
MATDYETERKMILDALKDLQIRCAAMESVIAIHHGTEMEKAKEKYEADYSAASTQPVVPSSRKTSE